MYRKATTPSKVESEKDETTTGDNLESDDAGTWTWNHPPAPRVSILVPTKGNY